MGVRATCRGFRTLPVRAAGRARDRRDRTGRGIGRRPLAHPRSVRHQRAIRGSSARGWPGRLDRLPRTARPPSGFLSTPRCDAAVPHGIAGDRHQPRVLFHLGADYALVLFPDLAAARSGGSCLALLAVLAGGRVLSTRRICAHACHHRQHFTRDIARDGARECTRLCVAGDRASDQGWGSRCPRLAAGFLCRGRR